jgi:predicted ATP-grasp superfamily ATP-dependent carboligase
MKSTVNPAIILGGGDINGLGVTRNLGKNGIEVYCVLNDSNELVRYSKYCKEHFVVPGVEENPDTMKKVLSLLNKRLSCKAYLHPTSDLAVLSLSQIMDELDNYVASIPRKEIVETIVIKKNFYQSLVEKKVPHPLTLYPDLDDFSEMTQKLPFPVFIKPSISQLFNQRFGVKGFVAHSDKELRHYLRIVKKNDLEVVIQQIIPGPTSNHYSINGYFDKNSNLLFLIARRKIRQPTFFSINSVIISIPLSQVSHLVKIIVNYLSSLRYHGIFGAEFKKDSRDGVFRLIEVNARSCGHNSHILACGVNHILTAYREALGEEVHTLGDYETGVYCINALRDLRSIKRLITEKRFSFRDVITPYLEKHHFVLLSGDDPVPVIPRIKGITKRIY